MNNYQKKIDSKGFEEKEYQKWYSRHQQEYLRKRLRVVKSYCSGQSSTEVAKANELSENTCRTYLKMYLTGGFKNLCALIKRPKATNLTKTQETAFKSVLLSSRPNEVGLEGNIWTGDLMCQYLSKTYEVSYKSGIYDLLERMNLSHQKSHSDYSNAKPEDQILFWQDLQNTLLQADERTAVVKFDEFSVSQRPTSYYGWAEKNTRPKVVTDEKNASAQMVF